MLEQSYNLYIFCALLVSHRRKTNSNIFSIIKTHRKPGTLQTCVVKPQLGSDTYSVLFIHSTNPTVINAGEVDNSAWRFQEQLPREVIPKLIAKI